MIVSEPPGPPVRHQTVFVIDDDDGMRAAIEMLLTSCGHHVRAFTRAAEFLEAIRDEPVGCIVIDVRMPELDGLALQRRMTEADIALPVIFVSGYADVALSVRAMRQGAYTFLTKPFREQDLIDAVSGALELERSTRDERRERSRIQRAFAGLDERERDIMGSIADGQLNKVIASRIGLSEISVKVIRARIMRKMGASSVAHLSRLAERLRSR